MVPPRLIVATLAAAVATAVLVVAAVRRAPWSSGAAGCGPAAPCPAGSYCDYAPDLCGHGKRPGVCRPRPTICARDYDPICACDGTVYANACAAAAAGSDVSVHAICPRAVPDYVRCGGRYCDAHTSYCEVVLSDVSEWPTDYSCRPLPAACVSRDEPPSCRCFPPATRCLSFCSAVDTGGAPGVRLTCRR